MARDLLEDLAPRWLLVVGIAGGMPAAELTHGDVRRLDPLDFSVEALLKDGSFEHAVTGGPIHHDSAILAGNCPPSKTTSAPGTRPSRLVRLDPRWISPPATSTATRRGRRRCEG